MSRTEVFPLRSSCASIEKQLAIEGHHCASISRARAPVAIVVLVRIDDLLFDLIQHDVCLCYALLELLFLILFVRVTAVSLLFPQKIEPLLVLVGEGRVTADVLLPKIQLLQDFVILLQLLVMNLFRSFPYLAKGFLIMQQLHLP